VTIGARLYADSSATTFDSVPSPASFTVTLTEPAEFKVAREETGAMGMIASVMAALTMLVALAF